VPLVDVTHDDTLDARHLRRLGDLIRDRLSSLPPGAIGVSLILAEGAWSQS
jgi:hypothetical protein